jgi:hypothetical protein
MLKDKIVPKYNQLNNNRLISLDDFHTLQLVEYFTQVSRQVQLKTIMRLKCLFYCNAAGIIPDTILYCRNATTNIPERVLYCRSATANIPEGYFIAGVLRQTFLGQ